MEAATGAVVKDIMSRGDFDRLRDAILDKMKTDGTLERHEKQYSSFVTDVLAEPGADRKSSGTLLADARLHVNRSRSLRITAEDIWEILDAGTTPLVDTLEDSVADAIERFAVSFNSKSPLVLASEVSETPTMPINGSSRQAAPEPYEPVVAKSASQAKGAAVKTPEKSNTPTSDDAGTSEKAERLPASSSLSSSVPSPPDTDAAAANATLVPAAPTTGQSHDAAAAPVPQEASPASGIGSTLEEEAESEVSDVSDVSSVHTSDLSGLDSAAEGDGATGMSEKAPAQRVKKPRRKAAKAAKPRLTLSLSTVEPKAVAEEPPVVAAKPRRRSRATKRKSGNEPTQKEPQPPIATAKRTRRSSRRSAGTEEAQETNWSLKIEPKMELLCRDSQEWYPSVVTKVDRGGSRVRVHFKGRSRRSDRWYPFDSAEVKLASENDK